MAPWGGEKYRKSFTLMGVLVAGSTRTASPKVTGEGFPNKGVTPMGWSLMPRSTRHMQMTLPGTYKFARKSPRSAFNPATLLQSATLCFSSPEKKNILNPQVSFWAMVLLEHNRMEQLGINTQLNFSLTPSGIKQENCPTSPFSDKENLQNSTPLLSEIAKKENQQQQ